MVKASANIYGVVTIRQNGEIVETCNLVVDDGLEQIVEAIAQTGNENMPEYIALGRDGTSVSSTDSDLYDEITRSQAGADKVNGSTVELEYTFGTGEASDETIRELGLFSDSSGGTMFARVVPQERYKGPDDTLQVTWTININAS